jgi:4-amino-4-deoxy-L-arabinose transferase-like glycosyltransferase
MKIVLPTKILGIQFEVDHQPRATTHAPVRPQLGVHAISRAKLWAVFLIVSIVMTVFHLDLVDGRIFKEHGSKSYGLIAESLLANGTLALDGATPTATRPPLYPLFLASIFGLAGDSQAANTVQSIMAGIMVGGLAVLAVIYTRSLWPVLVVILLYYYMDEIPKENITQRDTLLFSFLLVASCAAFIYQEREYRWWKVVVFGVLMGLAGLVRPLAIVGIFFACAWAWRLKSKNLSLTEIGIRLAIFLIPFYLVLLPWGIRNWITMKQFTLSSTTMGVNLWKGNNPGTTAFYPFVDVDELEDILSELPAEPGWWDSLRQLPTLTEVEQDAYFRQLALAYILEDPQRFLTFGVLKVYTLWLPQLTPLGKGDVEWTPTGAQLVDFEPHRYPIVPYLLLYLLMGIGLWQLRYSSYSLFFVTWVLFLSLIIFITFGESRFRYPFNVLSLPLAAVGSWVLINSRHTLSTLFQARSEE